MSYKNQPIDQWTKTDWQNALKEQAIKENMKTEPRFHFGDIIIFKDDFVGIVLKTWDHKNSGFYVYDVYIRTTSSICEIPENQLIKYNYPKELN